MIARNMEDFQPHTPEESLRRLPPEERPRAVREDLDSGARRFAEIDPFRLAELLDVPLPPNYADWAYETSVSVDTLEGYLQWLMPDDEDGPPETLEDMTVPNLWTLEGHRSIRPNPSGDYEPALSRTYNTPVEAFGRRLPIAGTPTKKMREVIRKGREAWRAAGIRVLDDRPHGAPPSQPGGGRPRR